MPYSPDFPKRFPTFPSSFLSYPEPLAETPLQEGIWAGPRFRADRISLIPAAQDSPNPA